MFLLERKTCFPIVDIAHGSLVVKMHKYNNFHTALLNIVTFGLNSSFYLPTKQLSCAVFM